MPRDKFTNSSLHDNHASLTGSVPSDTLLYTGDRGMKVLVLEPLSEMRGNCRNSKPRDEVAWHLILYDERVLEWPTAGIF